MMGLARKLALAPYCAFMIDATGVGLLVTEDSMHCLALEEFDSDTTPFMYSPWAFKIPGPFILGLSKDSD